MSGHIYIPIAQKVAPPGYRFGVQFLPGDCLGEEEARRRAARILKVPPNDLYVEDGHYLPLRDRSNGAFLAGKWTRREGGYLVFRPLRGVH